MGEINAACGRCAWCLDGLGRHCPNRTVLGILGRDGAFAEYLRLPDENLIPLPDSIPDELARLRRAARSRLRNLRADHLRRDDRIAVLGDGRLGALVAIVLRGRKLRAGASAGHHRDKLDRLAALGLEVQLEDAA